MFNVLDVPLHKKLPDLVKKYLLRNLARVLLSSIEPECPCSTSERFAQIVKCATTTVRAYKGAALLIGFIKFKTFIRFLLFLLLKI
jgi:hypothetical protein